MMMIRGWLMRKYTTKSGDMWDQIAYDEMGSSLYTDQLMKANMKHINTFIFPAGVVLTIPDIIEKEDENLPPWKRGLLDIE